MSQTKHHSLLEHTMSGKKIKDKGNEKIMLFGNTKRRFFSIFKDSNADK